MGESEPRPGRPSAQRSPGGFFYNRLMPWLLALMGLALAAVVLLVLAAMMGWLPPG